ncbi:MAG: DUF402 domain-containing protein [Caldilineaceae bacterium]
MRRIKIVSKKYNGTLRDEYESYLYAEDETMIVTLSPPGTPYYYHKKQGWFAAEDGLLEFYFKQKWYNVWHICEQNSGINRIYANIAMPATFQDDVLTWVDLDLDLRVYLDNSIELLDEDEFLENSTLWAYPSAVVEQARAAVAELLAGYQQRVFPLSHAAQVALYERIKATIL